MNEVVRKTKFDDGKMYHAVSQDETPILEYNNQVKNSQPEHYKYLNGKSLFHAMKLSLVHIEKMANGQCCPDGKKYRLFTPDKDEQKRTLLHIQSAHPEYMLVTDKAISKNKTVWQ